MRLHLVPSSRSSPFAIDPTLSCSQRTCKTFSLWRSPSDVFFLISKRFLKLLTVAALIWSCDRLFQRLITRWEKKWRRQSQRQQSFTSFQECPSVTESSALLMIDSWNRRQLLHHFENFYNVFSVSPLLERPQSKFFKPDFIRQFLEMSKRASELVLYLLKHLFIFHIVRTPHRATVFQLCGRTIDLYRFIKTSWFLYLIVLLISPSMRLAFEYAVQPLNL